MSAALEELARVDPAAVSGAARSLRATAAGLREVAALLGGNPVDWSADWSGQAADAAWTSLGQRSEAAARAAAAFEAAGSALGAHAGVLGPAVARAGALLARRAVATGPEAAELERDGARLSEQVAASAAVAARAVGAAAADAPPPRGWHAATAAALDRWLASALFGAGEAVLGLAATVAAVHPARQAVDPVGHREAVLGLLGSTAATAAAVVTDPRGTLAEVVDAEMWRSDAPRAAAPLLMGFIPLVGGAGKAASLAHGSRGVTAAKAASAAGRRGDERARAGTTGWTGEGLSLDPRGAAETAALLGRAAAAEPRVSAAVAAARQRVGAVALGGENRLKALGSLQRKVAEILGKDPDLVKAVDGVHDTLRYTFSFDDARYTAGTLAALRALKAQGLVPVAVKNAWTNDRPYQGMNSTWRDPGSSVTLEVQTHTPSSWRANKATHEDYETERVTSNPAAEREAAHARQVEVWSHVPKPRGYERITPAVMGLRPATGSEWAQAGGSAAAGGALLLAGPARPQPPDRAPAAAVVGPPASRYPVLGPPVPAPPVSAPPVHGPPVPVLGPPSGSAQPAAAARP